MDRRKFVGSITGCLVARSRLAIAQKATSAVVGFLCGGSPSRWVRLVAAFRQGLNETGYFEGKNIDIEFRWAEGQDERLPALAADLVRRQVAVLGRYRRTQSCACGQIGHFDYSDCIYVGCRSRQAWPRRQSGETGGKYNWNRVHDR